MEKQLVNKQVEQEKTTAVVEEKKFDPFAKGFSNKPAASTNSLKPEIQQTL